jgi:hypothetical protein
MLNWDLLQDSYKFEGITNKQIIEYKNQDQLEAISDKIEI